MRIELEIDGETQPHYLDPRDPRTLSQWLRHENLPLNTRCGERGICKACQVELVTPEGVQCVPSCTLPLREGLHVRIPSSARLSYRPQVMSSYTIEVPFALASEFGRRGCVAAVDIGTTTISVMLLNLADGTPFGVRSDFNPQIAWGDDALTRINLCRTRPESLGEMAEALWGRGLIPLAQAVLGAELEGLQGWVLSGNPTMLHLALGEDPGSMGVSPFRARFLETRWVEGAPLHSNLPIRTLPNASAYVGSDIVGGLLASGFAYADGPCLYVDVGTNGEIVFCDQGRRVGCATAAGPAFEGSGLSCGVRAGEGAISRVTITGEGLIETEQIGAQVAKPIGICGSAYVDFLAEGHRAGLLTRTGRATPHAPVQVVDGQRAFVLGSAQGKRPITITEHDIARLLQAKAAIGAGIVTLLETLGVRADEVNSVYLAGGFGMHLNLDHAIACGLLPGFREEQVKLVGNASLAGAHLAALDPGALAEMSAIAESVDILELNLQPGFEDAYLDNLSLD